MFDNITIDPVVWEIALGVVLPIAFSLLFVALGAYGVRGVWDLIVLPAWRHFFPLVDESTDALLDDLERRTGIPKARLLELFKLLNDQIDPKPDAVREVNIGGAVK